jgi:hypothetical protein
MIRINDPDSRHTVQQNLGCEAASAGVNCSPDPRFTLDPDNYTNVFTTGYPVCIPSTVSRTFQDVLGLGVTTAQALGDGTGDALCPQTNRPAPGQPVPDSRLFAPLLVGDHITAEGNFETIGGVRFLSCHSMTVSTALVTQNVAGQPDYMFLDEVEIDAPGYNNERVRALIIGYTTLPSDVLLWSIHYDPEFNNQHLFPLASTRGCDTAGGAGECTQQGIGGGASNIFKVRYDVDFLIGGAAKPRDNPCLHLRAEPLWAGLNICPTGASLAEQIAILSPLPHEIQAMTRHKINNIGNTTIDINGNEATNGQYLFPFGLGLGGIGFPEFVEIDLGQVATPFLFAALPWNLDRRLSPNGCDGPGGCEGTVQPLDPFPNSELDPRTQTNLLPIGPYGDQNYTDSTLSNLSNRIFSYVDAGLDNFNGNNTLVPWPPAAPGPLPFVPAFPADPICLAGGGAGGGANLAPVARDDTAATTADAPVVIAVLNNDFDFDGTLDPASLTIVSQPVAVGTAGANPDAVLAQAVSAGTAVANPDGTVLFTPAPGFDNAVAIFSYTISDTAVPPTVSLVGVVRVTVGTPPAPPIANPDFAVTTVGVGIEIDMLANDIGPFNPATVHPTAPANGLAFPSAGHPEVLVYIPRAGFTGTDSFTYTVANPSGIVSNAATVTITVNGLDVVNVTRAQFIAAKNKWRIDGTAQTLNPANTVTVTLNRTGLVLGPVSIDPLTGAWRVVGRFANPGLIAQPGDTITVSSSFGGVVANFPVQIK